MLIGIAPGRSLRWSPVWPCGDATVLFDAASGDFWVLGPESRRLIDALCETPGVEHRSLLTLLPCPMHEARGVLRSLADAGLLARWVDGVPINLEGALVETD